MHKRIFIFLLAILLACLIVFFFQNNLITYSINRFAGLVVMYDSSGGNIFQGADIKGLLIETGQGRPGISAEEAVLNLRSRESLKNKRLIFDCVMHGVKFVYKDTDKTDAAPEDNILALPFSPDQKYEKITFTAYLDRKTVEIRDFDAYSKDIRMGGDCLFVKGKDDISLDIKISFSPEISNALPEDVRTGVLSRDENGWYSTAITYKGNVLMLKALYSLTA
ncbi:MAG: hypothetical protein ACE5JK_01470 [Candidatus Omnitrophota bacterium]